MKKNNKGFTLIEVIVIIAIIGIILGVSSLSINTISSSNAKSCATQLNSFIGKCRVNSLSRTGDVYIRIYMLNGKVIGEYFEKGELIYAKTFSDGRAEVSYKVGNTVSKLGGQPGLKLSFNRSTGGLTPHENSTDYCTEIYVSGGGKTYTIKLIPSTGNHSIS